MTKQLTWLELSALPQGTRLVFAQEHDTSDATTIPEGATVVVAEQGLNEMIAALIVLPDDPALRDQLADWDGEIWLHPPLDRDTGNREAAWHELSPLALG